MCFRPGSFGLILGMNLFCCEWSTVERVEETVTGEKPATELILRVDAPDPGSIDAEMRARAAILMVDDNLALRQEDARPGIFSKKAKWRFFQASRSRGVLLDFAM